MFTNRLITQMHADTTKNMTSLVEVQEIKKHLIGVPRPGPGANLLSIIKNILFTQVQGLVYSRYPSACSRGSFDYRDILIIIVGLQYIVSQTWGTTPPFLLVEKCTTVNQSKYDMATHGIWLLRKRRKFWE